MSDLFYTKKLSIGERRKETQSNVYGGAFLQK